MTTVLVADDDRDIRDLVTYALSTAGHHVVAVPDGEAALAAVSEVAVDVAILDRMMPAVGGLEVCRALRADPATASMAIIMLTARAQETDVGDGFEAGVDDYITKPFSPRELIRRIDAVLARRSR